jgi:hypothetical protein
MPTDFPEKVDAFPPQSDTTRNENSAHADFHTNLADAIVALEETVLGSVKPETLTIGPEGDIEPLGAPSPSPRIFLGEEGAPPLENGWELNGSTNFEGRGEANEYSGAQFVRIEVHVKHTGPSAATIFTLPVGFRPLEEVKEAFITLFPDGRVVPNAPSEEITQTVFFESEFVNLEPASELLEGNTPTVTVDGFGNVRLNGILLALENATAIAPIIQLPSTILPSQRIIGGYTGDAAEAQLDDDGFVYIPPSTLTLRPGAEEIFVFVFDAFPTFRVAA